jgi:peptidoglycan/xylan/chitin deacetylase (PgdA/CDA1 family)
MRTVMVTTSWDDGHKHDVRLARMLKEYGLKATFYVSPMNREFAEHDLLTQQQIRDISENFEIGAHTVTHPRLPAISQMQAKEEIVRSKIILEEVTGKTVSTFCYPGGAYTAAHAQFVKDAGYNYARTVARHSFKVDKPHEAATSLHAYNHWSDVWKIARFARLQPVRFLRYLEWGTLARAMFDRAVEEGGVYHIWGHSWEIDRHNDWERLEGVFRYISGRPGVRYVTNSELV